MGALRRKDADDKLTEEKIQHILSVNFLSENSKKYQMENLHVYAWESDYLCFTKTGYAYECEIKISRNDFLADKKKHHKHLILEGKMKESSYRCPNYFYYAVPENMITEEEVPDYAGLLYIRYWGKGCGDCYIKKKAPKICDDKQNYDELNLRDKFYFNYVDWKRKAKNADPKKLKEENNRLIKECSYYDEKLGLLTEENMTLKSILDKNGYDYKNELIIYD